MRVILFLLSSLAPAFVAAQSFIIDDAETYDDFNFRQDGDRLTCFYKTWNSDKNSSHYRTISFDGKLNVVDTISYRLDGICSTLGDQGNEKYSYHIFRKELSEQQVITFMVTDKFGKTIAMYEKTIDDLRPFFKKKIKKLSEIQFQNIKTHGEDGEILLLRPILVSKYGEERARGEWIALNLMDGTLLWHSDKPATFAIAKTAGGKLITTEGNDLGLPVLHFYDLRTGKETAAVPVNSHSGNRTVSVFEVSSSAVVVAGGEFERSSSNRNGHLFLARFDLAGNRLLDRVDTSGRFAANRLLPLGGAFNRDGDLILIGESYKVDATDVAFKTLIVAASIFVGAPVIPGGNVRRIVLAVVSARISPDGEVKEFNKFPVDHRSVFSTLAKDGQLVYLRHGSQLLVYDLDDLAAPPRSLTTLGPDQQILTFSGHVIGIRKDDAKREIILETISGF